MSCDRGSHQTREGAYGALSSARGQMPMISYDGARQQHTPVRAESDRQTPFDGEGRVFRPACVTADGLARFPERGASVHNHP